MSIMSELQIYESLERVVRAAEANNSAEVTSINYELSGLLHRQYGHLPNWSMNPDFLKYDYIRNAAGAAVSGLVPQDQALKEMRELFSQLPKPTK